MAGRRAGRHVLAPLGAMNEIILFALLGLGTGAVIAGLAISVVVTFRGSGIINLATGAVAMVAAYAFWALQVRLLPLHARHRRRR